MTDILGKENVARPEWFALQLVEGAPGIEAKLPEGAYEKVRGIVDKVNDDFEGDADIAVADARYAFVSGVTDKAVTRRGEASTTMTDRIDRVILNRWLGLPIFLAVMYVMFLFTQNLGGAFIDFFDISFAGIFVDGFGRGLEFLGVPEWLKAILADGIGGGITTVATFIPPIFFLFLFLAMLEDSGYMARAAFVMDRIMRAIGLPGKAFVPLIVGFGCNVPAIMATRTMDKASDRIITIMMAPFMSCGARMPVYVLFATAFFPTNGQNLVFGIYLIGIAAAVLTGFLIKRVVLPGEVSSFVMEIPPYHLPTFKGVMLRTWDRLKSFLSRAGRVIVLICAILGFLNSWGTDGTFGNQDSEKSVLSEIGRTIVPVLEPIGVSQENWPAAVGIFTGVFAKEAVVGTLNSLYEQQASAANAQAAAAAGEVPAEEEADEGWSLGAIMAEAGQSIVDNLADLGGAFVDPMGRPFRHGCRRRGTGSCRLEHRHDAEALRLAACGVCLPDADPALPALRGRHRRGLPRSGRRLDAVPCGLDDRLRLLGCGHRLPCGHVCRRSLLRDRCDRRFRRAACGPAALHAQLRKEQPRQGTQGDSHRRSGRLILGLVCPGHTALEKIPCDFCPRAVFLSVQHTKESP